MLHILIVLLCVISSLRATDVYPCVDGSDLPKNVKVVGCDAPPCNFVLGQDVEMYLTFDSPHLITSFKPLAQAEAFGMKMPYPLGIDDGCPTLVDSECPLDEGDEAIYYFNFHVSAKFPKVELSIEFTLVDQDEEIINCFNITGRTVDSFVK